MKRKFTLAVLAFLISCINLNAQGNYVNQVIILNEGHYDYTYQIQTIPVTIGAYNPSKHVYSVFDTIQNARFGAHVILDGSSIYVAADSTLIRYDANTYQRLATATLRGARKLAVWNNQLLVSRGEYLQTFNSYFAVYDKANLSLQYELPVTDGPQYASEGIVIKDNVAYIAINNGFEWGNEVGLVGRIDLINQKYLNEINLGSLGKNPEAIFLDNGTIYTVNNNDFSTTSISNIDIISQSVNTTNLMTVTGCGASAFSQGYVMFQLSGDDKIRRFSTSTLSVQDTLNINQNIYGMATDDINHMLYVGQTDYTTYGKILIYDLTGSVKDSFDVSVSPGNIAFDVRTTSDINEVSQPSPSLIAFPNPAQNEIRVMTNGNINNNENYILSDITGREMSRIFSKESSFTIDIHSLEAGVYFLRSLNNPDEKVKIIKQ